MDVDLRIAELLSSRQCHALAATIGAVGNGLELIEEFDDSLKDEAMDLVVQSAGKAADQLKFFRMAYGFAGYQGLASLAETKALAEGMIEEDRLTLDWSAVEADPASGLPGGIGKLMLVLIELAGDTLPRGGTIALKATVGSPCEVIATGMGARFEGALKASLTAEPDFSVVTARTVHACYAVRLAAALGYGLDVGDSDGSIRFTAIPRVGASTT